MPRHFSFNFAPILPAWAVVAVAAILALLLVHGSVALLRKRIPARWVTTLAILRAVIIGVLVLCLLQPAISFVRDHQRLPELIVLVDTSQSMGIKSSDKTRLDTAIDPLKRGALLDHLRKNFDVHLFAFDRSAYPLENGDLGNLKPAGDSTHFADSLATAVAYQRQSDSNDTTSPARALLVSDGDDLGDDDLVAAARKLAMPVDTLAIDIAEDTTKNSANKIAIAAVQSPRSVMIGSEAQIVVTLRADGAVSGAPELSMLESGKTIASQPVAFRAGESEQTVRLSYRPSEVGVRQYELKLSDAPYQFSVRVIDDRKQVLILEDNWRWEFKFFRRVLEDDPSFSFTAMLSRGQGQAQFTESDRKVNLAGFPQGRADLVGFDTFVLGDVNPRRWPPGLAAALAAAVKDDGKSLIVLAGPRLASLAESVELNPLLPVDVTAETASPIEGPIDVRPTREGAASPMFFNLAPGALTPLDRIYPPLRKRPAATILLEAATRANAYGNLIVMADHTVGRGRVLFVGTDALWNWQTTGPLNAQGVTPYAAFWQQTMRALTPIAGARTGDITLNVQPDRSRYEAGQRATITATMKTDRSPGGAAPSSPSSMTIQSTLTLPDQKQIPLAFAADASRPDTYRAEFETSLAGQYKIATAVATPGQPAAAETITAIDVDPPRGEMSSARVNEANLVRIAAETGGRHVRASDPATWPGNDAPRVTEARTTQWHGGTTLLVVLCTLLGIDWLLRLLRGYV